MLIGADGDSEVNMEDIHIQCIDKSRYSSHICVAKYYIGNVIGAKRRNIKRIECDTECCIKIVSLNKKDVFQIIGSSMESVKAARKCINEIVIAARLKQRATHFNSIPMTSPEILKNFDKFKEDVLRECPDIGIEESVFISRDKLHITMGVMCLKGDEEQKYACKLMAEAKEKVVMPILHGQLPLMLKLQGISYMDTNPSEVNVLYGLVSEVSEASKGVLQKLADGIVEYFRKSGYMGKDHGRTNINLHVTLMNSKYRDLSSVSDARKHNKRQSFDGSNILKKFSDYYFGTVELRDLHISQLGAVGDDGYYLPIFLTDCTA